MANGYDKFFKDAKNSRTGQPKPTRPTSKTKAPEKKSESAEDYLRRALAVKGTARVVKRKPSWVGPVAFALMASVGTAGYLNFDKLDQVLSRLEIQLGIGASAIAAEKTSSTSGENKADPAASTKAEEKKECVEMKGFSEEELSHFNKLNERKQELDLRENELAELEEELHKQKAEIETRLLKLEQIREEVATVLKERVDMDQARVGTLVDFYSNMKPKQAAEIFANLNEDLAVEILGKMKKKNAADILNLLEPTKARALSEKFTGYQRR